jgi:hypothetical protein
MNEIDYCLGQRAVSLSPTRVDTTVRARHDVHPGPMQLTNGVHPHLQSAIADPTKDATTASGTSIPVSVTNVPCSMASTPAATASRIAVSGCAWAVTSSPAACTWSTTARSSSKVNAPHAPTHRCPEPGHPADQGRSRPVALRGSCWYVLQGGRHVLRLWIRASRCGDG